MVSRVRLRAGDRQVAVGWGKGVGVRACVGAYFEALERYYTSAAVIREAAVGELRLLAAAEVGAQAGLRDDVLISRWADEFPDAAAGCTTYRGAGGTLSYPAFLVDPRYQAHLVEGDTLADYRSLLRYCSSIGTAAGACRADTTLHALCELIEHDSLSMALLRWFILDQREIRLVREASLPRELTALLRQARAMAGTSALLVDITTDLGIPSYLATVEPGDGRAVLAGHGASPVAHHAARRALEELIQSISAPPDDPGIPLAAWPVLQQCARLPISQLLAGDVTEVDLRKGYSPGTVHAGLRAVTARLKHHGMTRYSQELTPADAHMCVVATLVPGLERFSLVRLGVPVLPVGRGWALWSEAATTAGPRQVPPAVDDQPAATEPVVQRGYNR
jgi:ribosomal protein S12 methylthiotransferase accessory factor